MSSHANEVRLSDLVLAPTKQPDPAVFDIGEYADFVETLCGDRQYQIEAIRTAAMFLLGGRYSSIDDLVSEVWGDADNYDELKSLYVTENAHLGLLVFPGKLAATLDLATATGKSYVLYALARIALNEGAVRRVLVLSPTKIIRHGLREKFTALLARADLEAFLPPRPGALTPTLVDGTETVEEGTICIENREQVYPTTGSSLRDSFNGHGGDTLVLNDEAHHVYDREANTEGWFEFLADERFGFHRILGVSGTPFIPEKKPKKKSEEGPTKRPSDYFADVLYRFSVREAITYGYAKEVRHVDTTTGPEPSASTPLYQELIWETHQANKRKYGRYIKPLTIVVAGTVKAAHEAKDEFVAHVKQYDEDIEAKCLVVTSDDEDKEDRKALLDVEKPDDRHEFIFSVSMLTEGWDAKGVFLIVPHEKRAFDSHLLISQVLGRGLRRPEVPDCPKSVVQVLNHTKWASEVKQLVDDVMGAPNTVTLAPLEQSQYHFTVDLLATEITTIRETRPAPAPALATNPGQLLADGIASLCRQHKERRTRFETVQTTTGEAAGGIEVAIEELVPLGTAASELHGLLRVEAKDDPVRLAAIEDGGREGIIKFIEASLSASHIYGDSAAGISPDNIKRIREALLSCFPISTRQKPLESVSSRKEYSSHLEQRSTTSVPVRTVHVDQFANPNKRVFWSPPIRDKLVEGEQALFSSANAANPSRFLKREEWRLRCPMTFVFVSHNPERSFVQELTDPMNCKSLTAWVKSTDQGFYTLPFIHLEGSKSGQRGNFNPDFILYDADREGRPHVYLVELKADDDDESETKDKAIAAEEYVARLNAAVGPDRPTYSFHLITPADLLQFFDKLREGSADDFVGNLHSQLRFADAGAPGETAVAV